MKTSMVPSASRQTGRRNSRANRLRRHPHAWLGALVLVLLAAALLRWHGLAPMERLFMHDEAFNGWDALRLLETRRLTPFLPTNNGRETGWLYGLMPFLAAFGARPFALHVAAGAAGILTVAAVYRLGRELFDHRVGLWAAASLTALYWHTHLSHLGLRAILQPLIGALGFALLLGARRRGRLRDWALGGLFLGLLSYTYFAARLWLGLAVLPLVWWALRDKAARSGALLALAVMIATSLPQLLYTARAADESLLRVTTVAVTAPDLIWQNVVRWANAFISQGDLNTNLNLAGRPILDPALIPPFLAGVLATVLTARGRRRLGWLAGLGVTALAASIFSDAAPHFLRAAGFAAPLALVLGLGFDRLHHLSLSKANTLPISISISNSISISILLLLASLTITYRDFSRWLGQGEILAGMEAYINEPAGWIRQQTPADEETTVFFTPFSAYHPNVAFHRYGLAPRGVAGFDPAQCLVIPDGPTYYMTVPALEPDFVATFEPWGTLALRAEGIEQLGGAPLYRVYELKTSSLTGALLPLENAPLFAGAVSVRHTTLPASAQPGETLTFWLGFRAEDAIPSVISAFVHLHGEPSPYEGGLLRAAADQWLCEGYPAPLWQPSETVLQQFQLALPADLPLGAYRLALGLYEAPAGPRLPLTAPTTNPNNYAIIQHLEVIANP